jgi:hypothetical protein
MIAGPVARTISFAEMPHLVSITARHDTRLTLALRPASGLRDAWATGDSRGNLPGVAKASKPLRRCAFGQISVTNGGMAGLRCFHGVTAV